ncbi:unnamed protein product [Clonostachys chloroleuca]|uniref:Uncharacterized protein n=1 Tax=Clonostachys chloroleuca TaxID=1926264 RepID=A0AA35LSJ0_9HYPO|nr:unnamed protein product [Clonostachys chloroleuca]
MAFRGRLAIGTCAVDASLSLCECVESEAAAVYFDALGTSFFLRFLKFPLLLSVQTNASAVPLDIDLDRFRPRLALTILGLLPQTTASEAHLGHHRQTFTLLRPRIIQHRGGQRLFTCRGLFLGELRLGFYNATSKRLLFEALGALDRGLLCWRGILECHVHVVILFFFIVNRRSGPARL